MNSSDIRPLLLSTSDLYCGADRSALRLHEGLRALGVPSTMIVQNKLGQDPTVLGPDTKFSRFMAPVHPLLDNLPRKFYPHHRSTAFTTAWFPDFLRRRIHLLSPDVVNLHMVGMGFMQIETLKAFRRPIVWTMHDMWTFTGGCHYSGECDGYQSTCGACPQLNSHRNHDLSRWTWRRKNNAWKHIPLTVVCPSRWLATAAGKSSLLRHARIEVIPYGLNIKVFRPIDPLSARDILHLPKNKKLIFFGSMNSEDTRKGFHLLRDALQQLIAEKDTREIELVCFGTSQQSNANDLEIPVHRLGKLNDDITLALAYSAADVFVAPSVEDNLPNTVMEAMACGTPCVAFDIGGMRDMIVHQENGYLASALKTEDLARGLWWVLESPTRTSLLGAAAREKVIRDFASSVQAERYHSLYKELADKAPSGSFYRS